MTSQDATLKLSEKDGFVCAKSKMKKERKINKQNIFPINVNQFKSNGHKKLSIEEIEVLFPFQPYETQKQYMKNVIKAIKNKKLALIESPTGTGKSLCLLCSALAYLKISRENIIKNSDSNCEKISKIIYVTRTHTQIENIINELKLIAYQPKNVTIGSRELYCLLDDIEDMNSMILNYKCLSLTKENKCKYKRVFSNNELLNYDNEPSKNIKTLCKSCYKCPYYFSLDKSNIADLVFLPYNYIFDSKIRQRLNMSFKDSILLIDEGHNIPEICTENFTKSLSQKNLKDVQAELRGFLNDYNNKVYINHDNFKKITYNKINDMISIIGNILISINEYTVSDDLVVKSKGCEINYDQLYNLFNFKKKENIDEINDTFINDIDNINIHNEKNVNLKELNEIDFNLDNIERSLEILSLINEMIISTNLSNNSINRVIEFFKLLQYVHLSANRNKFRFFLECLKLSDESSGKIIKRKKIIFDNKNNITKYMNLQERTLFIYCLDASCNFQELLDKEFRSIIVTSGTLTPFPSFQQEMGIQFDITHSGDHVVNDKQVVCGLITEYKKDKPFHFVESTKDDKEMICEVGNLISRLTEKVSGGILVFFSSYSKLELFCKCWTDNNIQFKKHAYYDLYKIKNKLSILEDYKFDAKQSDNGAILFSVNRSVFAEGVSFKDSEARLVILVGVPCPSLFDKKINFKKDYFKLKVDNWYDIITFRSINQSIGRVVRHDKDYGAVLLIDKRYGQISYRNLLSSWISNKTKFYDHKNYNNLLDDLDEFYNKAESYVKELNLKTPKKRLSSNKKSLNSSKSNNFTDEQSRPLTDSEIKFGMKFFEDN